MFKKSINSFLCLLTLGACSFFAQGFSTAGEAFESVLTEESLRLDRSQNEKVLDQKNRGYKGSSSKFFSKHSISRPVFTSQKYRWENGRNYENPQTEAFLSLPLEEEDKIVIRKFIKNLSDRTLEDLIADRDGLESIKEKLDSLHPLRVAGFIFSDATTLHYARILIDTDVKSNLFIILLQIEIQTAKDEGILNQYLPGFIDFLGLDENVVYHHMNKGNYLELIRYMLHM